MCDTILQVAMGQYHTCALRSSGTVVCWGYNAEGQLGNGTTTPSLVPVVVPGLSDVVQIVAGFSHTCALLSSGQVRCWGQNVAGEVGSGVTSPRETSPTAVLRFDGVALDRVTRLATGQRTTCALRTTGALECWGENPSGMIIPSGPAFYTGAQPFDPFGKGGVGRVSLFAIGATYIVYRSGTSVDASGDPPGPFLTGWAELWWDAADVVELGSGRDHVCIRRLSGAVECLGDNTNGQLADGSTITPMFETGTLFTSSNGLMLFDDTTCSRNTLGQVYCIGANNEAQCTGPGGAPVLSPRRVDVSGGGAPFSASLLGSGGGGAYRTPCLVSSAGAVHCWGNNIGGSIGDGTTAGREYPTRTLNLTP